MKCEISSCNNDAKLFGLCKKCLKIYFPDPKKNIKEREL